jgi:hypothetical protein
MKKLLVVKHPWMRLEKGQGFFVPCLDTDAVRVAGLNAALACRIFDARAYVAIKDGFIGVWFYRMPPRNSGPSAT